jgi:hypothetical protein
MKKLLLIVFSFFLLTSCSKDEDATIIGKWYFYKNTYFESGQETSSEMYENQCATKKDYIEFQTDDVVDSYYHDEQCIKSSETSIYYLDGTDLVIDGTEAKVTLLTDKSLKIKLLEDNGDYVVVELKK